MPKFERPFWIVYSLFIVAMFGTIWGAFYYLESMLGTDEPWFMIPAILVVFAILFVIMDWVRARYWILKVTTFEEYEEEMESQKLSIKGVIAFTLFAIAAFASFIFLDDYAENIDLTPTAYTLSAIGYMCIILILAFGLIKYLSGNTATETEQ
ncbi:MAG: hypothetical protein RI564_04405 [Gracilimonas sp.]|nr:hypothetical protein [Gracilimonas sp.]